MENSFLNAISKILNYLKEVPLSNNTVRYYSSCYRTIVLYCQTNEKEFLPQTVREFLEFHKTRYLKEEIVETYYLTMRRAVHILLEYLEEGTITWVRRKYTENTLRQSLSNILNEYEQSLLNSTLSTGSIKLLMQMVNRFLVFLEERNIYEINQTQLNHVKDFIIQLAPRHKASITNLTWPIKNFFIFLNNNNYSNLNVTNILANPVQTRKKVLPCFSQDELAGIFSSVDTSTIIGKRDYAIMKLAIGTGLRMVDITNLCLSDIDWRKNEITITQQKTNSRLTMPLLPDVGNAIADYILNGRPETSIPYIFLRDRMPYIKLQRGALGADILKKYLPKANISHMVGDGKTFHAFRRTFGTKLVETKVPIATVAQLLGHRGVDSSKQYIALNDDMLRICCMDISKYATTKEGLE